MPGKRATGSSRTTLLGFTIDLTIWKPTLCECETHNPFNGGRPVVRGGAVGTSRWPSSHTFQFSNRKFQGLEPPPSCSKQGTRIRSNREKKASLRFSLRAQRGFALDFLTVYPRTDA
jgi:hypothetical protein